MFKEAAEKILWDWTLTEKIDTVPPYETYRAIKGEDEDRKLSLVKVFAGDKEKEQSFKTEMSFFRTMFGSKGWLNIREYYETEEEGESLLFARFDYAVPLKKYIEKNGLTRGAAVKLGADICAGIEKAHKSGCCLSDIRPEYIYVDEKRSFKLAYVNCEALTGDGSFGKGKEEEYPFCAPEIHSEGRKRKLNDIYSLGLILYWLLNGEKLPDDRQSMPEPENGFDGLNEIIMKALAVNPADRYQTATQMKKALQSLQKQMDAEIEEREKKEKAQSEKQLKEDLIIRDRELNEELSAEDKKKMRKTVILILLAVLLAAGAYGAYRVLRHFNVNNYKASLSESSSFTYDGKEKKPAVEVEGLKDGEDYTLIYENNISSGQGEVKVKGKGRYHGTRTLTFKIKPGNCDFLKAEKVSPTEVILTWEESEDCEKYWLHCYDEKTQQWLKIDNIPAETTSYTLTNLNPDSLYLYQIRGITHISGDDNAKGEVTETVFRTMKDKKGDNNAFSKQQ